MAIDSPILNIDQNERKILRLDKELNNAPEKNIAKPNKQTDTQLNATPIKTQPKNIASPKNEPEMIEPDMFDRILEKIGF